jgi:hypothetical protein
VNEEGELRGITRLACVGIDVTNGIRNVVAWGRKNNCTGMKCEACGPGLSVLLLLVVHWYARGK